MSKTGRMLKIFQIMIQRYGNISRISRESGVSLRSLHRIIHRNANPTLQTVISILRVMGYRLAIKKRKVSVKP